MISRALQGLWARSSPAIGYNMNMKSAEFVAKQDLLTDAIKKNASYSPYKYVNQPNTS